MKRYLNSFLITLILYASAVFTFITVFADNKIIVKKEKPSQQIISLKHIELIPEQKKIKQIIEPVIKKEEVKKPEFKKEEIKEAIKTVKKVVKKKIIKKKVVKKRKEIKEKEVKKKEIKAKKIAKQKEIKKESIPKSAALEPIKNKVVKEKTDVKKEYLSKNLSLIRKYIKQNVHYPKIAKRLNIQGVVKVKFTLHTNGVVDNIVILSGHNRLKKSTINAVKDASSSFPRVKKDITIELPIEYKLI